VKYFTTVRLIPRPERLTADQTAMPSWFGGQSSHELMIGTPAARNACQNGACFAFEAG
jgi:hypothetical protein